jgi:hypothetical protein
LRSVLDFDSLDVANGERDVGLDIGRKDSEFDVGHGTGDDRGIREDLHDGFDGAAVATDVDVRRTRRVVGRARCAKVCGVGTGLAGVEKFHLEQSSATWRAVASETRMWVPTK